MIVRRKVSLIKTVMSRLNVGWNGRSWNNDATNEPVTLRVFLHNERVSYETPDGDLEIEIFSSRNFAIPYRYNVDFYYYHTKAIELFYKINEDIQINRSSPILFISSNIIQLWNNLEHDIFSDHELSSNPTRIHFRAIELSYKINEDI